MDNRLICPECKFPTLEGENKCRVCGYAFTGNELAGEQQEHKSLQENTALASFLEQLRTQNAPVAQAEPEILPVKPEPPKVSEPVIQKPPEVKKVREQPARKAADPFRSDNAFTAQRPVRFCSRCGGVVSQNTNFCSKCNTYCPPKAAYKEKPPHLEPFKDKDDKCDDSHIFGAQPKKNNAGCAVGGIIIGVFIFIVIVIILSSTM